MLNSRYALFLDDPSDELCLEVLHVTTVIPQSLSEGETTVINLQRLVRIIVLHVSKLTIIISHDLSIAKQCPLFEVYVCICLYLLNEYCCCVFLALIDIF